MIIIGFVVVLLRTYTYTVYSSCKGCMSQSTFRIPPSKSPWRRSSNRYLKHCADKSATSAVPFPKTSFCSSSWHRRASAVASSLGSLALGSTPSRLALAASALGPPALGSTRSRLVPAVLGATVAQEASSVVLWAAGAAGASSAADLSRPAAAGMGRPVPFRASAPLDSTACPNSSARAAISTPPESASSTFAPSWSRYVRFHCSPTLFL